MTGKRYGRVALRAAMMLGGLAALAGAVGGPGLAGASVAASRIIALGNNVEVTLAKGWTAGKVTDGKLALTDKSNHSVLEILTAPDQTAVVTAALNTNFATFEKGFGLTHLHVTNQVTGEVAGKAFTDGASFDYTASYKKEKLGGVAIEYRNAKTNVGAFAVVVAKQADVNKIRPSASAMLQSMATNP